MWRFILITFGFLGFAFWELSGGSDYAPRENSLQARAAQPAKITVAAIDAEPAKQTSASKVEETGAAGLTDLQDNDGERFEITLASVKADLSQQPDPAALENKAEVLTKPDTAEDTAVLAALEETQEEVREVWPGAIELFAQQKARQDLREEAEAAARAAMDIRYVTASAANMRGGPSTDFDKVGRLTEGAEVAVLQSPGDGWIELQVVATGETGWMADWLVSAPAQ